MMNFRKMHLYLHSSVNLSNKLKYSLLLFKESSLNIIKSCLMPLQYFWASEIDLEKNILKSSMHLSVVSMEYKISWNSNNLNRTNKLQMLKGITQMSNIQRRFHNAVVV